MLEDRPDEPLADTYSYDHGAKFLEEAASSWSEKRKCVTCHTNGLALAVPSPDSDAVEKRRAFAGDYLRKYVEEEKKPSGQFGSVEGIVATTALLALSDARTEVLLHMIRAAYNDPQTSTFRSALDEIARILQNMESHDGADRADVEEDSP